MDAAAEKETLEEGHLHSALSMQVTWLQIPGALLSYFVKWFRNTKINPEWFANGMTIGGNDGCKENMMLVIN